MLWKAAGHSLCQRDNITSPRCDLCVLPPAASCDTSVFPFGRAEACSQSARFFLVVELLQAMAWIVAQPVLAVCNRIYALHFSLKSGERVAPWFTAQAALPYSFCCVDSLEIIPYVEEMLGGVSANRVVVSNAFAMPLFQHLSQFTRAKRDAYRDGVTLLSDLELIEPAFSIHGDRPSCCINIVLEVFAKKPKKYAPLPRKIQPRPIIPHQPQCTLKFTMAASGREIGTFTVSLPWACNAEAASTQLGRTMDLCLASMDNGQTFQHISQLRLSKQAPSNIDVLCVQQAFVNLRSFQVEEPSDDRPKDFITMFERAVEGMVCNYPWAGWRRHYKEFAALAEMLSMTEEPTVPAKAIQLILQAYAQGCRRRYDGRTSRRHRTWHGCYHAMITNQLAKSEPAARAIKTAWCLAHQDILEQLSKLIAAAPVGGTYFA